jgi:hypothetical protein
MENTMTNLQSVFTNNESFINFCKNYIQFDNSGYNQNISHPNNKILYQYVNNDLEDNDTHAVMNHIANCERCAKEVSWIMKKNQQLEDKLFRMARSVSFFQNITDHFNKIISRFIDSFTIIDSVGGFHISRQAQLAFISILTIIMLPSIYVYHIQKTHDTISVQVESSSKLKLLVDQHFEILITDRSKIAENFLLPWEKKSDLLLFSPADYSDTNRKFASGLYSARELLINDFQTNEVIINLKKNISPNDSIFLLGKWCFLMKIRFLSDVDISDLFKKQSLIIIDQFNNSIDQDKQISKENIQYIKKKLNTIDQLITTWPDDKIIEHRYKNQISEYFSKIIDYFSPLHI